MALALVKKGQTRDDDGGGGSWAKQIEHFSFNAKG